MMAVRAGFICDCEPVVDPFCQCDCANCAPKNGEYIRNAPCCLDIAIAGFADSSPVDCYTCSTMNRTYHATYQGNCTWAAPAGCQCCTETPAATASIVEESGAYIIRVTLGDDVWEYNFGSSQPDCCQLSGLELSHVASGTACNSAAASCAVSVGSCTNANTTNCGTLSFNCRRPDEITVDCSSIVWGNAACKTGECEDLAAPYVLDFGACFGSSCSWGHAFYICGPITKYFGVDFYAACDNATGKLKLTVTVGLQGAYRVDYRGLFSVVDEAGNCLTMADILAAGAELDLIAVNDFTFGATPTCALVSYPTKLSVSL
jgi:hypothetical protein